MRLKREANVKLAVVVKKEKAVVVKKHVEQDVNQDDANFKDHISG